MLGMKKFEVLSKLFAHATNSKNGLTMDYNEKGKLQDLIMRSVVGINYVQMMVRIFGENYYNMTSGDTISAVIYTPGSGLKQFKVSYINNTNNNINVILEGYNT